MEDSVEMDQLQTFVTIARLRSFTRAATSLHRSQPAISRRIDLLEAELGVPLLERRRGGAFVTDAGAALLPHAEATLAAARDGGAAVRALTRGDVGTVGLALVGTLASTAVAATLGRFRRRHPGVRLQLQTATSQDVGELVRQGEATLGLRYLADPSAELVSEPIGEEALVVACGADHRLAGRRRVRARELAGEPWVAFPPRRRPETFAQRVAARLATAGIVDPEIVPVDSLTAQKRLVEAGFGVALLIESGIKEELGAGTLRLLRVPELEGRVPIHAVRRRRGFLGPVAEKLLVALRSSFAKV